MKFSAPLRSVPCTRLVYSTEFETPYQSALVCSLQQSSFNNSFQVSGIITIQIIMSEKVFLSSESAIPSAHVPSVSRVEIASSSRNNQLLKQLPFMILDEITKSFPKFNATGRNLLIKFNSPVEEQNPGTYIKECITSLTNYSVDDAPG